MARQNGQLTWVTPLTISSSKAQGNSTTSAAIVQAFVATERVTVYEVGAAATDSTTVPASTFSFRVKTRTAGLIANDVIIPVFTSVFAAEGGIAGDALVSGTIDSPGTSNKIANGVITNTASLLKAGNELRAYTEVTLQKGDILLFEVVGTSAGATVAFYARVVCDGAGLVEANDVDSN